MKKKWFFVSALGLLLAGMPLIAAATGSIGVATSVGSVTVNESTISGNADLADGSRLQTTAVPADVKMTSGADVLLATHSAGSFFSDHVLLEHGALRATSFNGGVAVNAAQLQVTSDDPGASAIVRMTKKTVEVASIGGAVNVMDGGMLTRVAAGTKMAFDQQPTASPDQSNTNTNTGANPAPAPKSKMPHDEKVFLWAIGAICVAGLVIGLTAAAQGKSPF